MADDHGLLGVAAGHAGWWSAAGILGLAALRSFMVGQRIGRLEQKLDDVRDDVKQIKQALINRGVSGG